MKHQEINELLINQRTFFAKNITKDITFRKKKLEQLKKSILKNEQLILDALHQDLRKPEFEAYTSEIYLVIKEINYVLKHLDHWAKNQSVSTSLFFWPAKSYIHSEPYGIVLIISPWNYPFYLTFMPLIAAIAAGNCAIIKPSEQSPTSSKIIQHIIQEIFEPHYIACILGGATTAQALLEHTFDYILFTGSTSIGKKVMEAATQHLTPLTLELGGKSPCIVTPNISLKKSAQKIAWGKFLNAGQNCISPDYVLIHKKDKNLFIQELNNALTTLYGADPQLSNDYARIINDKHFERLLGLMNKGDTVIGGQTNKEDLYISPTILENITLNDPIMKEEIFGPLLPILTYNSLDEALTLINKLSKPLALYIFSNNQKEQNFIICNTQSGTVCINDTVIQVSSTELPFGGIGLSGFGRYHGKASFDTFSYKRSIMNTSINIDLSFRYTPYKKLLKKFLMWWQ